MNQQNRHDEPSMDEILASIRKIISEDGPKQPGPLPGGFAAIPRDAQVLAAGPAPVRAAAPAAKPVTEAPASLSAKLNSAFGYVPASDTTRITAPAAWPRTSVKAAIDDEMADLLANKPASPAPASASVTPAAQPSIAQPVRSIPATEAAVVAKSLDIPTFEAPAPEVTTLATPPEPSEPSVVGASTATPSPAAAMPQGPVVIAATPRLRPSVDATLPPKPFAASDPVPAVSLASPVVVAAMPPASKYADIQRAPSASVAASEPVAPAPAPSVPRSATDDASAAAVASALGSLAAGLAASSRPVSPEIVVSAEEIVASPTPAMPAEKLAAAPSTSLTTEASSSPQGESVFTAPESFIGGVALTPVKTFDDTAAELLRPMLRQWLDSNMPRIVEKALRIELAPEAGDQPKLGDKS